ncbi:MAG TPA: FHA domain-containing protein [Blastocatellia bacterium]|nr:FHA domain-containing protein [Blastocatellia bacterium]
MLEVTLTIQSSEGTRKVPVTGDRLTVGRGGAADLNIEDRGLSRIHASIYRDGDRVWIVDEASINGTWVNGAPVDSAGAPLADGDKISIGDFTTIWFGVSPDSECAAELRAETAARMPRWAIMTAIALAAAVLIGVLGMALLKKRSDGPTDLQRASRRELPADVSHNEGDESVQARAEDWTGNSNSSSPDGSKPDLRKLYKQMTDAERIEFTYERARHISRMMGNREYQFTGDVVPYIKHYLDGYARRVGNNATALWGEDLTRLFGRARGVAPTIIRSFNAEGVPAVVGLYIPMIESEYRECLTSPVGAKGLFQFMPDTARGYGVDPADRCDVEKMAPAAAKYMKHRIAEFGTDAMSVALGIAGYNRSPDSVRRDLHDVLNSDNKERSFWTLIANSNKLDRFFQNENIKYVPKFFAAAIVGETPWAFGLQMNSLSTETQSDATPLLK